MNFKRFSITMLLLAAVMLLCLYQSPTAEAATIVENGTCGDNLTWTLDDEGTLTISGSGDMWNNSTSNAPWYSLREKILSVVIGEGVTSICDYAFYGCSNMRSVSIAETVTKIGTDKYTGYGYGYCFYGCTSLTQITIPRNVKTIAYSSFYGCTNLTAIEVAYGNTSFCSVDGILYDYYQNTIRK